MALVVVLLLLGAAFATITVLVGIYTRRVADLALTDQFRAAEAIVNGGIPDKWVVHINRRLAWRRVTRLFGRDVPGTKLALAEIDKLLRFYQNSAFYENAEARGLLLTELWETRGRWSQMTWEELVSEYGGGTRSEINGDQQTPPPAAIPSA